ncbi:hypothetical protein PILCRDRAFT_410675 [Piloderma croceum F 1598]|uniref:Uncharacterized protein n=1 Tax=Piloderma croceum (strain F 1598) TaxID=765440 RepID=A0A0C3G0Z6_PILCF|nr:hypothetical protein PILCRDRAFT_410675 [Piloderma croceum F 1598]
MFGFDIYPKYRSHYECTQLKCMLLFPSFPASSITSLIPIYDLLMSFCATIFFNAY